MTKLTFWAILLHQLSLLSAYIPARTVNDLQLDIFRILDDPSFQLFQRGESSFCCINGLSDAVVQSLKEDAVALRNCGFGANAGISNGPNLDIRKNVHQIWIRSAGSTSSITTLVGNIEGRKALIQFTEVLRAHLELHWRRLPSELLELSYLFYDPGAFYTRHIDTISKDVLERSHQRSVSFLLYLGDPKDTQGWESERDGGALRVYKNGEPSFFDVSPQPGTVVVFDSSSVPHEVMPTKRPRLSVVGWFGEFCSPTNN